MIDRVLNIAVLLVSTTAVALSMRFWWRSFRPIVTAVVETRGGGTQGITYNLVVVNSGAIPARNVRLSVADQQKLEAAILGDPPDLARDKWLAAFRQESEIPLLQNGARVACSFGMSGKEAGFWKYGASFPIYIDYQGYFGTRYRGVMEIRIVDSDSFTGHLWGPPRPR